MVGSAVGLVGVTVDGATDGRRLGLVEGVFDGLTLGVALGLADGLEVTPGIPVGNDTTNPPPLARLKLPPRMTSESPSPLMSPTPFTTTPPPVITTPCEAIMPATAMFVSNVLVPKIT